MNVNAYLKKLFPDNPPVAKYQAHCHKLMTSLILENRSADCLKTAKKNIIPLVALYLTLSECGASDAAAKAICRYQFQKDLQIAGRIARVFGRQPYCWRMMTWFIPKGMASDKWIVAWSDPQTDVLAWDIHKCLWHDICTIAGVPELTTIFCDGDWAVFGVMDCLTFERSGTLGYGNSCCDFKLTKND